MADLGNQKIKDTYQLVLQTDASGNLQNLTGGTPSPITINSQLLVNGNISGTTTNPSPNMRIEGQYIKALHNTVVGEMDRIWLAHNPIYSPSMLTGHWKMIDNDKFYWGTGNDLSIYHTGTESNIDNNTGNLNITSSNIYLGDDTSTVFVQDNLTVNDFASLDSARIGATQLDPGTGHLYVEENLTVDGNTFYADKTNGVGVGTVNPTHTLTVSGGTGWTLLIMPVNTYLQFINESTRVRCPVAQLTTAFFDVGDKLKIYNTATSNTTIVEIEAIDGSADMVITTAWADGDYQATPGNVYVESAETNLLIVNDVSGNTKFQVSGGAVMSGSTDLVDMFASSGITNQDVYWSANTDGSITNSGNTDITTTGDITVGNVYSRDTYRLLDSGGTSRHFIAGPDSSVVSNNSVSIGNANFSDGISIINNISATGNLNVSGSTLYIGAVSGTGSVTAVGGFVGDVTGNADTVTITDNDNTNETNAIIFTSGGDIDGGNIGLESDRDLTYNPSTGTLSATTLVGAHANADSAVQPTDTFHIGTTSVAHNRGSGALTLEGLTLTTPVISSISNTGTITLPTATDTLVGRATTDTLTNKTLTSPVLTTPNIGTPSAGVLSSCTGYPESALPSSINAIKIADGTVTSTEFQYINTLSANAQTQINTVHSTRSHFVQTTAIVKVPKDGGWCGFNRSTGGLNTNGYWNVDTNTTDVAVARASYTSEDDNSLFTTPYAGKLKRLLIQGSSQTGQNTGDGIAIDLSKATITDGDDRPDWSIVTGLTKNLPGTIGGATGDKSKHYVWDIPISMDVAQYDTFLILFRNVNSDNTYDTWLPINFLLEFEYTI